MKQLNGTELAEFIKERQTKQVRSLRQSARVAPKLVIISCNDDPIIRTYIGLKKSYGEDIAVEVEDVAVAQSEIQQVIAQYNSDDSVNGIIVQLPLIDQSQTDEIVNSIDPAKDVDALGNQAALDPATPTAIMWLLAGYNIDLRGKKIVIVGNGRLVGAPMHRMLGNSGLDDVTVIDINTKNPDALLLAADVVISATGHHGVIHTDNIKHGAVVVDAGVASEHGKLVGDAADNLYDRDDLIITPKKGGVGPITVCALFDNVIRAAQEHAKHAA